MSECLDGPVQETQRGREGSGAPLQPPGVQGGGGLGQTLSVPGAPGPHSPLPPREQGGAGREYRGEVPPVWDLPTGGGRSEEISGDGLLLSGCHGPRWFLSEKVSQALNETKRSGSVFQIEIKEGPGRFQTGVSQSMVHT